MARCALDLTCGNLASALHGGPVCSRRRLRSPQLIPKSVLVPRPPKGAVKLRVSAEDVMELLSKEYGPFEWTPRYEPAWELVYTVLSQHTSDINSKRAFDDLMATFGSLEALAAAEVADIERVIRPAGLFRVKAPRIKTLLNQVHAEIGSYDLSFLREMPLDQAKSWLRRLDGIGPKTAAIVLCFSLGLPAMPVDTHIYRVAKRLRLIGAKVSADRAHDILEPMVAPEDVFAFHLYLINHGRRVCKARHPRCGDCVLAWGCPSRYLFQRPASGERPKRPG